MFNCPTCGSSHQSYKAMHRHKTTKHPETIQSKADRILLYNKNPNYCKQCDSPLPYEKKNNNCCNSSCSASYSNKNRDPQFIIKTQNTWRSKNGTITIDHPDVRIRPYGYYIPTQKPNVSKICPTCNTTFISKSSTHTFCRPTCNTTSAGKIRYRILCKFNLNNTNHPSLFNSQLISKHGWYSPSNKGIYNPSGVCWDHLYRIQDGFINHVDPSIMSHPANAELVPWTVNISRNCSTISLDELIHRIQQWESGQYNLPTFYVET
jgi:hypothetical protein